MFVKIKEKRAIKHTLDKRNNESSVHYATLLSYTRANILVCTNTERMNKKLINHFITIKHIMAHELECGNDKCDTW